jgi:putative thiamine transport system ATP-binding protein
MLEVKNLEINTQAGCLTRITASVEPGQVLTIMGPSGVGKSTILNWIAGFLPSEFSAEGELSLNGKRLETTAAHERQIGVMYQDALLFNHLTVEQNIAFGMPSRLSGDERKQKAKAMLDELSLGDFATRHVDSLSGGQQARVALLRTLACEPKAILLDEPFSKLDSELRDATRRYVFERIKAHGLPCILVTHDALDAEAANGPVIEVNQC